MSGIDQVLEGRSRRLEPRVDACPVIGVVAVIVEPGTIFHWRRNPDGGETQVKVFLGWTEPSDTYGDKIPETIFFNMNLVRIPEKYDIKLNKQSR